MNHSSRKTSASESSSPLKISEIVRLKLKLDDFDRYISVKNVTKTKKIKVKIKKQKKECT